jgi:LmbE family N-acetylglucosaminyl deacetylase
MLVLAPHPDDEVFGCGGVVAQAAAAGGVLRIVVLTDGQAQGEGDTRRQESRLAMQRLGAPEPEFWGLEDRSLDARDPALAQRLRDLLDEVRPRVVLVPSPAEVHPDHRALALALYQVLHRAVVGSELGDALAWLRLAAYEVSAVLRPSLLVDVTEQWESVLAAAKAYVSQVEQLPYIEVLQAIATARRLTLPASVRQAEAYHVVDMAYIRSHSAHQWAAAQGPSARLEDMPDVAPLEVVVVARGRHRQLRRTLASVASQVQPPTRVVVVDAAGGGGVADIDWDAQRIPLEVVTPAAPGDVAAALQLGLETAAEAHLVCVDEGDVLQPEHLLELGLAVSAGATVAVSDVTLVESPDGAADDDERGTRWRAAIGLPELEPVPLAALAIPRREALKAGGFRAEMGAFAGSDLLLRLAHKFPPERVFAASCEHLVEPSAGDPEEDEGKAQVNLWRKNSVLRRPRELAAAVHTLCSERDRAAREAAALQGEVQRLGAEIERLRADGYRLRAELDRCRDGDPSPGAEAYVPPPPAEVGAGGGDRQRERMLEAEVARLTSLLESIYASRAWRLHQTIERFRGRR